MEPRCAGISFRTVVPLLSIVIPVHNQAAYTHNCLASLAANPPHVPFEIIFVDDASTDDTLAQARAVDDGSGRLKLISLSRNVGPSAARNRALRESKTPWIGILDADDFFLPGRLKGLLAFANNFFFLKTRI